MYRRVLNESLRGFRLDEGDMGIPDVRIGGQNEDHSNTPIIDDGIGPVIRGQSSHPEEGFVIFLDALGVKGIWERFHHSLVVNKWDNVIRAFMNSMGNSQLNARSTLIALSDTIILPIPLNLSVSNIDQVFGILIKPFIESIKNNILFRGVISHGVYYLSRRLIIGRALDEAAAQNGKLNWIGVALTPQLAEEAAHLRDSIGFNTANALWHDNVPLKELQVYRSVVLNWPYHDIDGSCYKILLEENRRSTDHTKYQNTFAFYDRRQKQ